MTTPPRPLTAFGAAHLDRIAQLENTPAPASVPGRVRTFAGGAAFNVCRHVAASGSAVTLHTPCAIETLATGAAGVRLAPLGATKTEAPSYTAILDPDGELVVAVADMHAYDDLEADTLLPDLNASPDVLVDANLPETLLKRIAADLPPLGCLYAMAVSPVKVQRLEPIADRIDVLFANTREVAAFTGDIERAAKRCRSVVMTEGAGGVTYASDGHLTHHAVEPVRVVDVTGAGDALAGGFIAARLAGSGIADALAAGERAAARTLGVEGPFPEPEQR